MDLSRAPNERKLYLCKWYFKAGFALLPFLWSINSIWFFNEAFRKPAYEEQKEIKKYVIFSLVGTLAWIVAIVAWVVTFQLKRTDWGEFADNISFIVYKRYHVNQKDPECFRKIKKATPFETNKPIRFTAVLETYDS